MSCQKIHYGPSYSPQPLFTFCTHCEDRTGLQVFKRAHQIRGSGDKTIQVCTREHPNVKVLGIIQECSLISSSPCVIIPYSSVFVWGFCFFSVKNLLFNQAASAPCLLNHQLECKRWSSRFYGLNSNRLPFQFLMQPAGDNGFFMWPFKMNISSTLNNHCLIYTSPLLLWCVGSFFHFSLNQMHASYIEHGHITLFE